MKRLIILCFQTIILVLLTNCRINNNTFLKGNKCSFYYDATIHKDIFTSVDTMPQYPGGLSNLYKLISVNYKIPVEEYFQSYVLVSFIIDEHGKLINKKAYKGNKSIVVLENDLSPSEKEIFRILDMSAIWQTGKCQNIPVSVLQYLPIKF